MRKNGLMAGFVLLGASTIILGLFLIVIGTSGLSNQNETERTPETHHVEYDLEGGQDNGKSSLLMHYQEKSEHVIGRIYIPDTTMETPIVDTDYYFRRDLEGNYDSGGVPFTTEKETFDFPDKNCIIYGHRLDSGEDFGMLKSYLDQTFYDEHDKIFLESEQGISEWRIISVFTINIAKDPFFYTKYTDLEERNNREFFLDEITSRNLIKIKEPYSYCQGDSLMTLSTCHYETDKENGRLVLVAAKQN